MVTGNSTTPTRRPRDDREESVGRRIVELAGCVNSPTAPEPWTDRGGKDVAYDQAAERFGKLREHYDRIGEASLAAEALWMSAWCREKLGQRDLAILLYARLLEHYPRTLASAEASDRLSTVKRT